MTLPALPKQNKKKEADFGLYLRRWLKEHPQFSMAMELKQTEGNSIPFKEVKDEQLAYAFKIRSNEGVLIRVLGTNGEPDYIWLRNMPSYIFVKFPKFFCAISPDVWVSLKERSPRKSLSSDEAKSSASIVVCYGK